MHPNLAAVVLGSLTVALWSNLVSACAVCGGGFDDNQWAYLLTTALLSFVPVTLIGIVVFIMYRKFHSS